MPLISVLLPVKDAASTLEAALSSTLRALPRDAEVAVLDDGSADDSASIASGFADPRVRVVRNECSVGVGAGSHQLLTLTDSEFVARMDGDDICLPGRFQLQLRDLRRGVDLAVTPAIAFRTAPVRVRPELALPISAEAMPLHLVIRNPLCHPSLTARREALERVGGYRDIVAEDYDLWLRALAGGLRLERSAVPGVAYRLHTGQLSAQSGFTESAFDQPLLRDAYTEFVQRRFGVDPTWLGAIMRPGSPAPDRPALRELADLVDRHARRLPPGQRWLLSRTTRLLMARLHGG